eukprot:418593_1
MKKKSSRKPPPYLSYLTLSMNYIIIRGRNGNFRSIPSSNDADVALRAYNDSTYEITAVGLGGTSGRYAVCNQKGTSKWCMKQEYGEHCFHAKMKKMDTSQIKQIAFGPNNTYAIVKKSGYCDHYTLGGPSSDYDRSGPWKTISDHQNDIEYVGMTSNKDEWVVGYGKNGWDSRGMASTFLDQLKEAKSDGTIISATLGRKNWYYAIQSSWGWYYNGTDTYKTAMKACNDKKIVALY